MNIIQLIEKVKHWRDLTHSPRKSNLSYIEDIRSTIDIIIRDRYDNFKRKKQYSFQSTQMLRDQLGDLVVESANLAVTGILLPKASLPIDYRHIVLAYVTVDGIDYIGVPKDYDEMRTILRDPFTLPTLVKPENVYYIESNTGLTIYIGDYGTISTARLVYLCKPTIVDLGTEIDSTYTATADTQAIAYEEVVYSGVTISIGTEFTLLNGTSITSGNAVIGWTDTNLPDLLHEEIALKASEIGIKITENYNKSMMLEKENDKQ